MYKRQDPDDARLYLNIEWLDFGSLELTKKNTNQDLIDGAKSVSYTHLDVYKRQVYENDIYGFIGQNGAGKSTTMKIIMSLVKETQGQLELFESTDNQVNRGRIGAIIEQPALSLIHI